MARELQPDIFGDVKPAEPQELAAARLPWLTDRQTPTAAAPSFLKEDDWRAVLTQLDLLKKRVSELESSQSQMQTRQTELIQATKVRIERMMGSCQRMDEIVKRFTGEIGEKMSALQMRMNERKLSENKVQELVDRHSSMIQSYEVRLTSLQKILSEQEMQLMSARAALQESRRGHS